MISITCHVQVRHLDHWTINLHRSLELSFVPPIGCELSHGDWEMKVDRVWWDDGAKVLHLFAPDVLIRVEGSDYDNGLLRRRVVSGWQVCPGSQVKFDSLITEAPDMETVDLSMRAIQEGRTQPIQEIINDLEGE